MFFYSECSETFGSFRRHNAEPMIPGFGRPMQLLRDEIDRFRGLLTVYVRDGFSAYRQGGYECGCSEVIVIMLCSSTHNFMHSVYAGIQSYRIKFFTVY